MADSSNKLKTYELTNPMETFPGLTIDDLNRYLPAIRTVEDMSVTIDNMQEGMFLTKCIDGLQQLPDQSIDLIIANPPKDNWDTTLEQGNGNTLQEYYQWNQLWLSESHRVLNKTGAIYLLCPWQYSGMYQGLLSDMFLFKQESPGKINLTLIRIKHGKMKHLIFGLQQRRMNFYLNSILLA